MPEQMTIKKSNAWTVNIPFTVTSLFIQLAQLKDAVNIYVA